eukprot:TRINITY_DN2657_c0_g2_i3.p1 TRINITY_DN2657_c0_g2~~TRINITY_DN2657_c0_g2_i3.p1  ORF type:complete len:153 (-),score=46.22 TRINITY_DN2657_c0_g2_i3:33-491(-)
MFFFFFQAEDGIRDVERSRGLGDVYKRQGQVRNIVDASSKKDIADASAYDEYTLPKFYLKVQYCIACAIHARIVRVRQGEQRKVRFTTCKRLTSEEKEEQIRLARKRLINQKKAAEEKANAAQTEAAKVAEAVAQAQTPSRKYSHLMQFMPE